MTRDFDARVVTIPVEFPEKRAVPKQGSKQVCSNCAAPVFGDEPVKELGRGAVEHPTCPTPQGAPGRVLAAALRRNGFLLTGSSEPGHYYTVRKPGEFVAHYTNFADMEKRAWAFLEEEHGEVRGR